MSASDFTIVNGDTPRAAGFATGTRIETETGPAAVEDLRVGDRVLTEKGGREPILWLGQRAVDYRSHPRPASVWPVRIAKGAFGDNLPSRDLFVSPDHALYWNGVLIPAKRLVNGTTIRQMRVQRVAYHHIELARHNVIFAEELPAETYLDTGDRAKFSGGQVTTLHPDFAARRWEMAGYAPLVLTGQALEAARRFLSRPARQTVRHDAGRSLSSRRK